jgi:hypothetical protein
MSRPNRRKSQPHALGDRLGERLEARLALSGPGDGAGPSEDSGELPTESETLAIVGVDPAPGGTLTQAPDRITFTFDRPLDVFSLGASDLLLERLDDEGEVVWALDPFFHPVAESLDETGTQLYFDLPASIHLEPGWYRVSLSETAFLMGIDGTLLPEIGVNIPVGSFRLAPRGASLEDAIDLGTIGASVRGVSGALDFQADPAAVALYRFSLPQSGFFRFGAEIYAQRIGSQLDAALALFDAQGNVLSAVEFGLGDAPLDPFIFIGLPGGTYYLGVSGVGNLPGQPGGYDPALGLPESQQRERSSGEYQLFLVADPITEPTRLIGFELVTLDDLDQSPTGFTLRFSGVVTPVTTDGDELGLFPTGIELVDSRGRAWPVVPNGLTVGNATLNYVLGERLPAGTYTVRLAELGPLVDLAGNPPIAESLPAGVLATFTVLRRRSPHDSVDLGSAFPASLANGIERSVSLSPGESIAYRVVNLRQQFTRLRIEKTGGDLLVEVVHTRTGDSWSFTAGPGAVEQLHLLRPDPGALEIRFTAVGSERLELHWSMSQSQTNPERIVLNGVGQGPALNLRLIRFDSQAPGTPGPGHGPGGSDGPGGDSHDTTGGAPPVTVPVLTGPAFDLPGGNDGNSTGDPPGTPNSPVITGGLTANPALPHQSALVLGLGGQLIGRPFDVGQGDGGASSMAIASLASDSGVTDVGLGLPNQGGESVSKALMRRTWSGRVFEQPGVDLPPERQVAETDAMLLGGLAATALGPVITNPDNVLDLHDAPGAPFEKWLARLTSLIASIGAPSPRASMEGVPAAIVSLPFDLPPDDLAEGSTLVRADLSTATGVALTAAALLEGRRHLARWLGRRGGLRRAARRRLTAAIAGRRSSRLLADSMAYLA